VAQAATERLRAAGTAQVVSVETERIREAPPLPFDLGTLQEVCSRQLGLDVQETLDIAQALYETHKATTYPRSDSGYLPESMFAEVPTVLQSLVQTDPGLRPLIGKLDIAQRSRAWDDGKISAHHGIIPTLEPVKLSAMNEKERAVYRLIRAHYLAQFLPHHEYERTKAMLTANGESLRANGKRIVVTGWREALAQDAGEEAQDGEGQKLPQLASGTRCLIQSIDPKALQTLPPKPYTQGELVKAMKGIARFVTDPRLKQKLKETTGIGTEATRAGIIKNLLERGYLVKKGRAIHSSDTARALIGAAPAAISDPGMTAIWEQALDKIAAREMTLGDFTAKQAAWVAQLIEAHRHADLPLAAAVTDGPACPLCGAPMRRRKGKNGLFWSCGKYPECKGAASAEAAAPRVKRKTAARREASSA
jgi:DNA topoisomerase-3